LSADFYSISRLIEKFQSRNPLTKVVNLPFAVKNEGKRQIKQTQAKDFLKNKAISYYFEQLALSSTKKQLFSLKSLSKDLETFHHAQFPLS